MKSFLTLFFLLFLVNSFAQERIDEYLDLASLFKEDGDYQKAIDILEKAFVFSKDKRIRKFLGKLYYLKGNSLKAIKFFEKDNQDWQSFLYRGLIYEDLEKEDLAIRNYLKSIELKENAIALYRLGKIYYQQGNWLQADKFFSHLISFDPSQRLAYYYKGICRTKLGDFVKSHYYLSKAVNFYPANKRISHQFKLVKEKLGKDFFKKAKTEKDEQRKRIKLTLYKRKKPTLLIKVKLADELKKIIFKGKEFTIIDGEKEVSFKEERFYSLLLKNNQVLLLTYPGKKLYKKFDLPLKIKASSYPFYILDLVSGKGEFWHTQKDRAYRGDLEVEKRGEGLILVNILDIEEYLYGVLPSEISPLAEYEALKAQAVAARTIAFKNLGRHYREGFDFCSEVHCQVYRGKSREHPLTTRAVKDTEGEIIVNNNEPIEAFYHSNCGGCLRGEVFGRRGYLPHKIDSILQGRIEFGPYKEEKWFSDYPDTFCSSSKSNFRWQRVYDRKDFYLIVGRDLESLKHIIPLKKGECFKYDKLMLVFEEEKVILEGDLKLRNYFDRLRSSAFKVELKFSSSGKPEMLFFWGAGFGHGAGLCQEGAAQMAKEGYTYREILNHYYLNSRIKKIY